MAVGGLIYRSLWKGVTYSPRTGRWTAQLPGQVRRCHLPVGGQHLGAAHADHADSPTAANSLCPPLSSPGMQLGKSSKKCSTEEEAVQHIDQELDKAVREGEITRGLAQRYAKPRPSAVVGVTYDSSQRHWKADRGADPPRPHGLPRVRDTFPTRQQAEARIWSAYMEEQRAAVAGAAGSGIGGMRVQQLLLLLPQSVEQWRQRARAPAHSVPAEELSHMRKLGYDTSTPLYAASGLLSYNDTNSGHEMRRVAAGCTTSVWQSPAVAAGLVPQPRQGRCTRLCACCCARLCGLRPSPPYLQEEQALGIDVSMRCQLWLPSCVQACSHTPSCCARMACAARWWSKRTTCRVKSWRVRMGCRHHGKVAARMCALCGPGLLGTEHVAQAAVWRRPATAS